MQWDLSKFHAGSKNASESSEQWDLSKFHSSNIVSKEYADLYKEVGLDTLESDLKSTADMVNKAYSGWQDASTMDKVKEQVKSMQGRLSAYDDFRTRYASDAADMSELTKSYADISTDLEERSKVYSEHRSAKEFEKGIADYKYSETLAAKDFSVINAELSELEKRLAKAEELLNNAQSPSAEFETAEEMRKNQNVQYTKYLDYLSLYGYKDIEALKKAINAKKDEYQEAKKVKNLKKFNSVLDESSKNFDADFDKHSENSKNAFYAENKPENFGYEPETAEESRATSLAIYYYRTDLSRFTGQGRPYLGDYIKSFSQMKDDEFNLFTYYLSKDKVNGTKKADEYINALYPFLESRKANEFYKNHLEGHPFLETLFAVPVGLDQFGSGIKNIFNGEDDYIEPSVTQKMGALARNDLSGVGGVTYDALSTISNMAPSILASAVSDYFVKGSGAYVGAALMGTSAAGNAYAQALNMGYDKSQARVYSTLVGVSEAGLSYAFSGISKLGGKLVGGSIEKAVAGIEKGFWKFAATFGLKAGSEAFEEMAQEILDPLFENIALGYDKNGFEDIDWSEVAYSGLMALVTTGFFEGVPTARGIRKESKNANALYGESTESMLELVNEGLQLPTNSEAYSIALKYKDQLQNGKKLSGTQLNKQAQANENAIRTTDVSKIKASTERRLTELGETGNIPSIAEAITKQVTGEKLTIADRVVIKGSKYGERVSNEINPNNIASGDYSSYWAEIIDTQRINSEAYSKSVEDNTQDTDNNALNEFKEKLLATPDSMLTPAERSAKQKIILKRENSTRFVSAVRNYLPNDNQQKNTAESGESRETFREPSTKEIYRKETAEEQMNTILGRHENTTQRHLKDIAEKLGVKLRWDNNCSRGYYDPETNTIVLNPIWSITKSYYTLFKHEFVHYLETKKGYAGFKSYLINHSKAFYEYVRGKLEQKGVEFTGGREEALAVYTDIVLKERQAAEEIPYRIRKGYNTEKIHREIIADFVGDVLLGGNSIAKAEQALTEIAETNRTLLQKLKDWLRDIISLLKREPRNRTLVEDLEYLNQRIARVYDSAQKRNANKGEVKYSSATESNNSSIKQQLKEHLDEVNALAPVTDIEYKPINKKALRSQAVKEFDKIGYKIDRQNFGIIDISEKYINKSLEYINTDGEKAALLAVPKVLKRGIEISGHIDHKGRSYGTVTIAAPVSINGKIGNVAVVVKMTGKNRYSTHRILTPDGSEFIFEENKNTEPTSSDMLTQKSDQGTDISSVSNNRLSQNQPTVNSNSMQKSENNSSDKSWSVASPEFTAEMNKLTEAVKGGEISVDEFVKRVNELAENEQKVSGDLRKALAEQEEKHWDYVIDNARYNNQLKKRIKRQNEQLAKTRAEISAEITAQREERASKQKNIEHIRKTVSRIDKLFRTNSNTKHIPEELKDAVSYFVRIFLDNDVSAFDKKELKLIRTAYGDLAEGEIEISGYDEEIKDNIKTLEKRLSGKTLRQLDYYDTLLIRNIIDNFAQIIKFENEMFVEGKNYEVDQIGNQALGELTAEKAKIENGISNIIDKSVKYSNMTPIYFFDRIGGVFKKLFNDIVHAQDKWYRSAENAKTYIRQMKEKYNYSKWENDTLKFTTEKGDKIEITREQAMLLYATARRENKNVVQNAEHLFRGGVVIPPSKMTLRAILKKYQDSDAKGVSKITDAMTEEIDSRAHRILPQDIVKVMQWLTEEQIGYANAMVEYLSKDMAALGNEVSMQLYGITKFNEDYYIPYNSAQNYLYSQPGVTNEARLKHQSFTKETVHGANNPLVLSDFSEVCADHINRMCMYNALTIPLENMNKIFNYQRKGENIDTKDIKAEIERVHGTAAVDYIKQFLTDMNGNVRTSGTDKAINRWISRFKKGAVFASASVVVQQPSAVMRAMAYINPKYFAKTTLKLSERDYQQAVQYAPVAGIKEMGRFDTGVGAATTNWLLQETPKGLKNKVKKLLSFSDSTYRDDKLSYFAAKADEITWAHIWAAVKAEIADTTDLKAGSEEFFKACGERFTEVINYTQVYDSTISRSQIMRDKSTGAQMLTAFMSEPTVSLNLLMNAVHQAKTSGEAGKKFAKRAVGAFVGNVVLNALLKSLVTAGRDDDEDKTYLEKYIDNVTGNILSDINPLSMMPFVKDVISVFEGYTVERADMNLFSDLAQSFKILQNDNKTAIEKIESIAGSLAAFLGLPVKNVLRDMRTAYNIACDFKKDIIDDTADTDFAGIKYAIGDHSNKEIYEELAKAAEKDNEEEYQKIYKHLVDDGKSDSDIISGVRRFYKDSKEVKKETEKYVDELEDNKTYQRLDDEDKKKLKNNIASSLATEKTVNALSDKSQKYDELYAALRKSKKLYDKMRKEMIAEGYTAKQITDGVEIARIAYMKSIGIDVHEYLLYKIATNSKNADIDNSGGVSKVEKNAAIREMDIDSKAKQYFIKQHK